MDMIDVIRKAKVIAEGGMSDIHIGAQEKVSEFVDADANGLKTSAEGSRGSQKESTVGHLRFQ